MLRLISGVCGAMVGAQVTLLATQRNLRSASRGELVDVVVPFARASMTQRHAFSAVESTTWNIFPPELCVLLAGDSGVNLV